MQRTVALKRVQRLQASAMAILCGMVMLGLRGQAFAQDTAPPDAAVPPATALKGLAGNMQQRLAAIPYTENQDYNYAILTRSVLQDELAIAENQIAHGEDPAMRSAAKEIAASRQKEIEKLDRWIDQFQKYN